MLVLHSPVEGFVAFTVQDPGRGIVVTTGFKPKSKLPVNLGRLWTVGNIELDQTYISAHRFDTYILLDCGRGTIK